MIICSSNISIGWFLSISCWIMIVSLIIAFVWSSMRLIHVMLTSSLVTISFHEFESLSILHSRLIFNWFLMFFVIKSDIVRIQIKELSKFVWYISSHLFISTILEPDLDQSLLSSQRESKTNDFWFFKLLTYTILQIKDAYLSKRVVMSPTFCQCYLPS